VVKSVCQGGGDRQRPLALLLPPLRRRFAPTDVPAHLWVFDQGSIDLEHHGRHSGDQLHLAVPSTLPDLAEDEQNPEAGGDHGHLGQLVE